MAEVCARFHAVEAEWPAPAPDPFFNVNTPQDLQEAERYLSFGTPQRT
jgi:molybdopterin-guanine dinucleotide biosynthesis protein A